MRVSLLSFLVLRLSLSVLYFVVASRLIWICVCLCFFFTISLSGLLSSSLVRHDLILQFGIVIFFFIGSLSLLGEW